LLYNTKYCITLDPELLKPKDNQNLSNDNDVVKSNFSTETENFKLTGNLTVGENYGKKKEENADEEENNYKNVTYILDDKVITMEDLTKDFNFLEKKKFELTFQKELLELNEQIVEICLLYVDLIIQYDKIFPLQYISYLILRRIYFIFPQYIKSIKDKIIKALSNLSKFQGQFEWNTSLESRQFAYYLLLNDKNMSKDIKSVTAVAPYDIRYQLFLMQKTNMSIGFNNWVTVFNGKMVERKIEVMKKNTLVYISVNMTEEDYDITVEGVNDRLEYGFDSAQNANYVMINHIAPRELGRMFEFKVTLRDDNQPLTKMSYGPLSYCKMMVEHPNFSQTIKNLCKAIYFYYKATEDLE
jgi:hypothetical protein